MYCAPQTVKPGYGPAYLACYFVLTRCYTLTWVRKFCCGPYQMFTRAAGSPPLCRPLKQRGMKTLLASDYTTT